jgi:hypothetical protein
MLRVVVVQLTQQAQHKLQDRVLAVAAVQPLQAVQQLLAVRVDFLLVVQVVAVRQPTLLVTLVLAVLAAMAM